MTIEEIKNLLEEIEKDHVNVEVNVTINVNGAKFLNNEEQITIRNAANLLKKISNRSIGEIATSLGISRMTFYNWLKGDNMKEEHKRAMQFLILKELETYSFDCKYGIKSSEVVESNEIHDL